MTDKEQPLLCIVCDKKTDKAFMKNINYHFKQITDDSEVNYVQPYAATEFTTSGQYGSTVFDPLLEEEYLTINICDTCLIQKSKQNYILHSKIITLNNEEKLETIKYWNPKET